MNFPIIMAIRESGDPPPPDRCDLWVVEALDWSDDDRVLDAVERHQAQQFRLPADARRFRSSRTWQRRILGHYLACEPRQVAINRRCEHCGDPHHGRPRVSGTTMEYSVSHCRALLAVAVVRAGLVGVDVEPWDNGAVLDGLADRVLSLPERDAMATVRGDSQRYVVRAWVRKEAAAKCAGLGLTVDPRAIDVSRPTVEAPAGPLVMQDVEYAGYALSIATSSAVEVVVRDGAMLVAGGVTSPLGE